MFKVTADSLQDYLDFDPERKPDLMKLHRLIIKSAPALKRYFHEGTPAGQPGMRFKMIGYGKFRYAATAGATVEWPVIGIALQKNYISLYLSVTKSGTPLVSTYRGKLGELRLNRNNFSFGRFEELKVPALASLFTEAGRIFRSDPENPVRYKQAARR